MKYKDKIRIISNAIFICFIGGMFALEIRANFREIRDVNEGLRQELDGLKARLIEVETKFIREA